MTGGQSQTMHSAFLPLAFKLKACRARVQEGTLALLMSLEVYLVEGMQEGEQLAA